MFYHLSSFRALLVLFAGALCLSTKVDAGTSGAIQLSAEISQVFELEVDAEKEVSVPDAPFLPAKFGKGKFREVAKFKVKTPGYYSIVLKNLFFKNRSGKHSNVPISAILLHRGKKTLRGKKEGDQAQFVINEDMLGEDDLADTLGLAPDGSMGDGSESWDAVIDVTFQGD